MKLFDLREMAIRGGDITAKADSWAKKVENTMLQAEDNPVVGQMDDLEVRLHRSTLTVWDGEEMVMAASIDEVPTHGYCKVDDIWVKPSRRGSKLLVKLLIFLKNARGNTRLVLGQVHSDDTYQLLKGGGLKAFKKTWRNHAGEVVPFDKDTIDEFYKKADWELTLENTESWKHLIRDDSFTHSYEALSNAVSLHEQLT
jgi:hypothetical protein